MFNSVSLSNFSSSKPETAGTLANKPASAPSIFSTETAGSIASAPSTTSSSSSFCAMA